MTIYGGILGGDDAHLLHFAKPAAPLTTVRDIDTIDSELRLVAALRLAARERGGPLPSIEVADAGLDERRELTGLPRLTRCLGCH